MYPRQTPGDVGMSFHIQRAAGVVMIAIGSGLGVEVITAPSNAGLLELAIVAVLILVGSWLVVVKKEDK